MATFYDVHFHAMNLSHPNISAFLRRLNFWQILPILVSEKRDIVGEVIGAPLLEWQAGPIPNLLTMMENDIGSFFIILEYCLKEKKPKFSEGIKISSGDTKETYTYDKIVLIPLIMDFGYKGINNGRYFYNIPPSKPVVEQTIDLFNGIRKYCKYEMYKENEEYTLKERSHDRAPLFEIYPFMGINTRNYRDDSEQKGEQKIEKILNQYFEDYRGDRESLYKNMGQFKGVGDDIISIRSNFFAGIKLYPPLGFNPWPESSDKMPDDPNYDYKTERKKVELLYEYCCNKKIPITAHCGKLSYDVIPETCAHSLTSPEKWEKVLKNSKYSKLKLNLAHFGQQEKFLSRYLPETLSNYLPEKKEWEEKIIKLISEYDNVYTDFSFRGCYPDYYKYLARLIKNDPKLATKLNSRVLFGSDFMINLVYIDSYNDYLEKFAITKFLTLEQKKLFCNSNPEKFLFNKLEE